MQCDLLTMLYDEGARIAGGGASPGASARGHYTERCVALCVRISYGRPEPPGSGPRYRTERETFASLRS